MSVHTVLANLCCLHLHLLTSEHSIKAKINFDSSIPDDEERSPVCDLHHRLLPLPLSPATGGHLPDPVFRLGECPEPASALQAHSGLHPPAPTQAQQLRAPPLFGHREDVGKINCGSGGYQQVHHIEVQIHRLNYS